MSYILGALKKADQERRRESEVKIADWDQDSWNDPTPSDYTSRWLVGLATAGLIFVLVVFGFVALRVLETVPKSQPTSVVESSPSSMTTDLPEPYSMAASEQEQISEAAEKLVVQTEVQKNRYAEAANVVGEQPDSAGLPEFSGHLYFPGNPGMSLVLSRR